MINYKSYSHLSSDIKNNLHKIHIGNYDLVVGFPRSGMIPAHMIALFLNVHVTDFKSFIDNEPLKCGLTRSVRVNLKKAHDAKKILLVDDSIYSGESLKNSLNQLSEDLRKKSTTLSIYSNIALRDDIDIYLDVVPTPRVFEWNIFHHSILSKACVDIDGVLCVDPTDDENDDGSKYINFINNAKPKILPSVKIHSLVTSRLEKYREHTEAWLKKHNIEYKHLVMLDLPTKEDRIRLKAHAWNKSKYFKENKELVFFIESETKQAHQISQISAKTVYCVDSNEIINPGLFKFVLNNPENHKLTLKSYIGHKTPLWLKTLLRPLLKILRNFLRKL